MRKARPLFLLAALAAFCAMPGWHGAARANGLLVVINSADASVSLLDMTGKREVTRIPVLREPHHMALTPDGKTLLVGDTAGNALFKFDPATGAELGRVPVSDPYQIGFSPNGKYLTVAGLARNQIDILDGATLGLLRRIPAKSMPSHINYSPDSSVVYVTLQGSNAVEALSVPGGDVLWRKPVGASPAGILWLNGKLLVGDMGTDTVSVLDPASGDVVRKIVTGRGAHNLFLAPDQKRLYVCNRVDGSLSVLDPATLVVQKTIRLPGGPDDMVFAPDGKIWITRRFAHSVAILDPADDTFQTIEVGRSPHGIWLNPQGRATGHAAGSGRQAALP